VVAPVDHQRSEEPAPVLPDPYEIVSIRAVPAPSGTAGASWHRYEITQGGNTIVGYRQGAIDSVTLAIQAIVVRLNDRRRDRRGRVDVVLHPSSRAATLRAAK
jgi:hypothetical protein